MAFGFGPVEKIAAQMYRRELTPSERSNLQRNTDSRQGAPKAYSPGP
jgi:hypothetical protein